MFKNLFKRKKGQQDTSAEKQTEVPFEYEDSTIVTRRLDRNMPVELITDEESTVPHKARIFDENNLALTIGRLTGELSLPLYERGENITLFAYNRDGEHIRIHAVVAASSITTLVLRSWVLDTHLSKRGKSRYPLSVEGKLYGLEDTRMTCGAPCTVLDISESGARINTKEALATGDTVRLQLEILKGDGRVSMPCQVVWVTSKDGTELECGLVFAELEKYKMRDLRLSLKDLKEQISRETSK